MVVLPEYGEFSEVLDQQKIKYCVQTFNWWSESIRDNSKSDYPGIIVMLKKWVQLKKALSADKTRIESLKLKLKGFNPDYVYSNSSVFNFGFLYSRYYNIPHVWHLREIQEHYNFQWTYKKKYVDECFKQSELVIAISDYIKNNYRLKNNIDNIDMLHDPILCNAELEELDKLKQRKRDDSRSNFIFGMVGLIHPKKGQEEAIRAFSIVNNVHPFTELLIVGLGDQNELKRVIKETNVDPTKIKFIGHVSNPFKLFVKFNASLMCSRMEGLGRVTLESMAASVPVIGFKEGGTVELIEDKVTGLLYENGVNELAEKMLKLIEDDEMRIKIASNARRKFEKNYTSEIYADKFLNLLSR